LPRFRSEIAAVVLVSALLVASARPAVAADRKVSAQELVKQGFFSDFDELDLTSLLEGTEVTIAVAARRPEPMGMTSGAVTLVTADEIRSFGFLTLEDLLRTLPGFDTVLDNLGHGRIIARGLAPGLRGSSENVLILMNGHRLNEGISGGATAINFTIPISNIHHVEVLRGPASALYGDGAVAAVINLVTDGGSEKDRQNGLALSAGYGSFSREHATMEIGSKVGEVWVGGSADFYDTSGAGLLVPIDAQTRRDIVNGSSVPAISKAPGRINDDVRALETVYRVLYQDWKFLWRVKQEKTLGYIGATDAFGVSGNQISNREMLLGAAYERKLKGGLLEAHLRFTDGTTNELLEIIPPGFLRDLGGGQIQQFPSIFVQSALGSRRIALEGVYSKTVVRGHDTSVGLELSRESTSDHDARSNLRFDNFVAVTTLEPLAGFPSAGRNQLGLWVEDAWRAPWQVTATGALRFEQIGGIGAQLSPRLALVRPLPRDLTGRFVYSRAFQAPGFRDLFFGIPGYRPNPDLRAMTIDQTELSLAYRRGDFQATGTAYLGWVRDPITTEGAPSLARPTQVVNGEGINVRGLELTARRTFGEHSAFLTYALQSPRDAETGRRVADVPSHMATLGGTVMIAGTYAVSPTLVLRSARPRDPRDTRPNLGGYALFGVTARHAILSNRLELRAVLDNLFDQRYEDPAPFYGVPGDYPRAGRGLFFDAKYRF
jgi:outer membrane receptor for ferrienterochelin and colicins